MLAVVGLAFVSAFTANTMANTLSYPLLVDIYFCSTTITLS